MLDNKSGLWVLDLRPESKEEQMITLEMKDHLMLISQNSKRNIALGGPAGSGKTLFAQSIGNFNATIINLSKEIPQNLDIKLKNKEILILKRIDEAPDRILKEIFDFSMNHSVYVTSRNIEFFSRPEFSNFSKISIENILPKSSTSFKKLERYIINILKTKNIIFNPEDKDFQMDCKELFDKLWPNIRQIIRQSQFRAKTGKWVSIPL